MIHKNTNASNRSHPAIFHFNRNYRCMAPACRRKFSLSLSPPHFPDAMNESIRNFQFKSSHFNIHRIFSTEQPAGIKPDSWTKKGKKIHSVYISNGMSAPSKLINRKVVQNTIKTVACKINFNLICIHKILLTWIDVILVRFMFSIFYRIYKPNAKLLILYRKKTSAWYTYNIYDGKHNK